MTEDAVPEADAMQQREPVDDSDEIEYPPLGDEVPEADAWEQALPVPYGDEDERR